MLPQLSNQEVRDASAKIEEARARFQELHNDAWRLYYEVLGVSEKLALDGWPQLAELGLPGEYQSPLAMEQIGRFHQDLEGSDAQWTYTGPPRPTVAARKWKDFTGLYGVPPSALSYGRDCRWTARFNREPPRMPLYVCEDYDGTYQAFSC